MKIIKLGVDPRPKCELPWWIGMNADCPCGTVVELDGQDGAFSKDVDPDHGIIKQIRVSCPVCSKTIQVNRPACVTSVRKFEGNRHRLVAPDPHNGEMCPGCFGHKPLDASHCPTCNDNIMNHRGGY